MHKRWLNHYSNWCDLNRHDSKLQNFAPNFFNFKIILVLKFFENAVVSRFFTFTFCCTMPRCAPVGEILRPSVEEAKAPDVSWWGSITTITPKSNSSTTLHTSNLWAYASDVSWWVHTDAIIFIPSEINTHLVTTLPTPEGNVPITVSLSVNLSVRLVSMN